MIRTPVWTHVPRATYVAVLGVGVVLSQFANYIWYEIPVFKGQAPIILVMFLFFAASLALWSLEGKTERSRGMLLWFFTGLTVAWFAHFFLYRYFGDAFNYTSFLYVPIIFMLAIKPPGVRGAWNAILALAWTSTIILVLTFILEQVGLWQQKLQSDFVVNFDESNYFLPFNQWLGIEGRWPGPFGHNGDTAMIGALLIVIACAHWSKASWLFIPVGLITLTITSGRASIGAAAAGLVFLAMFADRGPFHRVPRPWRIGGGVVLLVAGALTLFAGRSGLTGRQTIWPAFIELWTTSPVFGVGGSGIAVSGGYTEQFGHAHSIYLDELARYGIIGFVFQFTALAIGVVIAARAAGRGSAGPLAVLVAFFITGITEPRNGWISPSVTGFLVVLMVVAAAAELNARTRPSRTAKDLYDPAR